MPLKIKEASVREANKKMISARSLLLLKKHVFAIKLLPWTNSYLDKINRVPLVFAHDEGDGVPCSHLNGLLAHHGLVLRGQKEG